MSVFTWVGRTFGVTKEDRIFWSRWLGTESWTGESVNDRSALEISTFWACVKLLAQTIGTLPCGVYKRVDGQDIAQPEHKLHFLVHDQPNADFTAVEFWESVVAHLCLWGNAYAEKKTNGADEVAALTLLRPDLMEVLRRKNGDRFYQLQNGKDGKPEEFTAEQIFHVRGFGLGGDKGLSPLEYARQTLGISIATDKSSGGLFANGMRPGGWLKYKLGSLKAEQREQVKKAILDPMSGPANAGKWGVLEGDFDVVPSVNINPHDAELLAQRRLNIEEICRACGVPPIMVGHAGDGQTMWGSGVEQIMLQFSKTGLRPLCKRIESAAGRDLFSLQERRTHSIEFNMEGLLRGDSQARAEVLQKNINSGILTPNEARSKENLPKMPGGDQLLVNSTLIPLEKAGEARAQPQGESAPPPAETRKAA